MPTRSRNEWGPPPGPVAGRPGPTTYALILVVVALSAGVVYRPWLDAPFEMTDFGEFLPILRHTATFVGRYSALSRYYGAQGRYYPLALLALDAKWAVFGLNVVGWQLARAITMIAVGTLLGTLLVRLGANTRAAVLAALLVVVGRGAVPLWLKVHLSDPLGMLFVLSSAMLATALPTTRRPWPVAMAAAAPLAAAVLTKETFVAAAPFVVLVGLGRDADGAWRVPSRDRRSLAPAVGVASALVITGVLLVMHHTGASAGGYSSNYRLSSVTLSHTASVAGNMFLPWAPRPFGVTNAVYAAVVLFGWLAMARHARSRLAVLVAALAAVALPAAGTAVYLPWAIVAPYYAGPFLIGGALMLAMALTAIDGSRSRVIRIGASAAIAMLCLADGAAARRASDTFRAQRSLDASVATSLAALAGRGTMVTAATDHPIGLYTGRMAAYGRAILDAPFPPVREQPCEVAHMLARTGRTLVLVYGGECGAAWTDVARPSRALRRLFSYVSFTTATLRPDSVRADIWLPSGAPRS